MTALEDRLHRTRGTARVEGAKDYGEENVKYPNDFVEGAQGMLRLAESGAVDGEKLVWELIAILHGFSRPVGAKGTRPWAMSVVSLVDLIDRLCAVGEQVAGGRPVEGRGIALPE